MHAGAGAYIARERGAFDIEESETVQDRRPRRPVVISTAPLFEAARINDAAFLLFAELLDCSVAEITDRYTDAH